MSFSDHLDAHLGAADTDPGGPAADAIDDEQAAEEEEVERTLARLSNPPPQDFDDVQVVELTSKVEGKLRLPDLKPTRQEVRAMVDQLTPADIRNEILLSSRDAAQLIGVTDETMRTWRDRQVNLPYYVSPAVGMFHNRRIYYRLYDLIAYRELVMTRITPLGGVHMPPPGMMGTPLE